MTRQKFTLTAALIISLTGCQSSCEYHAGTGGSSGSSSSGSEQPAPSQSSRRGGRQVTRVTVRSRPPVDQEARQTPAPAPAPEVVQPTPVEPAPAPVAQPAPEPAPAVQPPAVVEPAPVPAVATPAPDSGIKPRQRGRIRDRIQAATPATTGQADTPSNTPEPASTETPEEILRRRTDKQQAETHTVASPPPKRMRGLRLRHRDAGSEPVEKGNTR